MSYVVSFEPASAEDFEQLVAIRIEAMRESLERVGRFSPERARERFRIAFSPSETRHVLLNGARVGFVVAKTFEDHLLLDHLYVIPSCQGGGVGSEVLQDIFAQAASSNLPIKVGALRESRSNAFYMRHGFKLVEQGEFDNYYVHSVASAP